MRRWLIAAAAAAALAFGIGVAAAALTGTWTWYPTQAASNEVVVQQPINTDGSSNFKANGKAVIPIKFSLKRGLGPFVFESIGSDANPDNDFSFASFTPDTTTTFADITKLISNYEFKTGDCHGGSLRWQVRLSASEAVFIYYGTAPQFGNGGTGGCTPTSSGGADQSGLNLLAQTGPRYDTSQLVGGTFYDSYANAVALAGSRPILRVSLVLESGWQDAPNGDQRLTLTSATVGTAAGDNTFTPPAGQSAQATCDLPDDAEIVITKTSGSPSGQVNEPVSIQPADDNGVFRVVDCKLMYNLATSSLFGVGTYKVEVKIDGVLANGNATFDLK
jgi:hypothetical protein